MHQARCCTGPPLLSPPRTLLAAPLLAEHSNLRLRLGKCHGIASAADHPPPGIPAGFHWHQATSAIRILGCFIGDPSAVQAEVFEKASGYRAALRSLMDRVPDPQAIQLLGRWGSSAVLGYIWEAGLDRAADRAAAASRSTELALAASVRVS